MTFWAGALIISTPLLSNNLYSSRPKGYFKEDGSKKTLSGINSFITIILSLPLAILFHE